MVSKCIHDGPFKAKVESGLTNHFDSQFLVSGSVYEGIEISEYHVNSLGEIELKGIEKR